MTIVYKLVKKKDKNNWKLSVRYYKYKYSLKVSIIISLIVII